MRNQDPPFFVTPMLSVHNDSIFLYGKLDYVYDRPTRHCNSLANLANNKHSNRLSNSAKKKAKKAIKYLLYNASEKKIYNPKYQSSYIYKVGFITLTLPSAQMHSDQIIKKMLLNQFLVEAKKKWNMTNYVWKSERQLNGNVHFHILTDVFIPHMELRNTWNRIVEKLGYVTAFRKKNGMKSPNSTDIHSLYKISNISNYILKYMLKRSKLSKIVVKANDLGCIKQFKQGNVSVSMGAQLFLSSTASVGRIWACSTSLSNIEGGRAEIDSFFLRELDIIKSKAKTHVIEKQYVTLIYFDPNTINPTDTPLLHDLFQLFLQTKFDLSPKYINYPNLPPPLSVCDCPCS
jgi:hypothetical protein